MSTQNYEYANVLETFRETFSTFLTDDFSPIMFGILTENPKNNANTYKRAINYRL